MPKVVETRPVAPGQECRVPTPTHAQIGPFQAHATFATASAIDDQEID